MYVFVLFLRSLKPVPFSRDWTRNCKSNDVFAIKGDLIVEWSKKKKKKKKTKEKKRKRERNRHGGCNRAASFPFRLRREDFNRLSQNDWHAISIVRERRGPRQSWLLPGHSAASCLFSTGYPRGRISYPRRRTLDQSRSLVSFFSSFLPLLRHTTPVYCKIVYCVYSGVEFQKGARRSAIAAFARRTTSWDPGRSGVPLNGVSEKSDTEGHQLVES